MAKPSEFKDYYAVLGVDHRASFAAIKQAYRRLARQLHPDLKPEDEAAEERFKRRNEAYEVLSDRGQRYQYDRFGMGRRTSQGYASNRSSSSQPIDDFEEMEFGRHGSFEDILGDLLNRYG